jgi:hypothetical protein
MEDRADTWARCRQTVKVGFPKTSLSGLTPGWFCTLYVVVNNMQMFNDEMLDAIADLRSLDAQ